ncbi:uncharacterized protein LOC105194838 isoform X2 [Solenopsis invicta]|uniref:uncharacterized protein LOC105194838 isoform X2 n=1 Tax=Solenopsis invicta TaxID=13686 RepID=UPI00193CF152|nr:uncharacterized protein LOC105194838 isoform X2 [Solenopsis invicta]
MDNEQIILREVKMEPVEFVTVKEENNIDDLKNKSNYLSFNHFEEEERKQELTDALKYCIDLLKDAQIILDLQNSNETISKRSQRMGKEIRRRIMDMLYSMTFMDEEDEEMECQEDPMSLENLCDSNEKELIKDNIKSVEKVDMQDASLLNQSIECIDEDKSIILNNYENSVNSGSIKTVTSNKKIMGRSYKHKKEKIDRIDRKNRIEVLRLALLEVQKGKTLTEASREFDISRTTLQRHQRANSRRIATETSKAASPILTPSDIQIREIGRHTVFNEQQEKLLEVYLMHCSNIYIGMTAKDACSLAYQLASKLQIEIPESWKKNELAGRTWFYGYMQRHPNLILRNPDARCASLDNMDFLPSLITDQPIEYDEASTEIIKEEMEQRFDEFINRSLSISTSRTSDASLHEILQSISRKNMEQKPRKINTLSDDSVMQVIDLKQETRQMQIKKITRMEVRENAEESSKIDSSKRKKQDPDYVTSKSQSSRNTSDRPTRSGSRNTSVNYYESSDSE